MADASHQTRTPLTALRLRLENVIGRQTDVETEADLELAIDEVDRLTALVGDLLHLARADAHPPAEPVDVAGQVRERVDTWGAIADGRAVALRTVGAGQPRIAVAVPGALEQALDNVLDNAIDHAPPGSAVTVAVSVEGKWCIVTISDEGPGLSAEDRARATQRFWRGDTSRPGTGLGLAIATSLVQASGGQLSLDAAASGGLAVRISLPGAG